MNLNVDSGESIFFFMFRLKLTVNLLSVQVQLKEYVKLKDTIYEVDPKEEECFTFSRLLNFKVTTKFTYCVCLNNNNML